MAVKMRRAPRNRTGLRNRTRGGKGTYARKRKGRSADHYGTWVNGVRQD
jgi:stalled ribosome alternative rescue factor ArfA